MLQRHPILTGRFPVHKIVPTPVMRRRYRLRLWTATIILVRHADIVHTGSDPVLSPAGQTRAELLRNMLQDEGLSAVFVTDTNRSRQTGTPTATGADVALTTYPALDAAWLAARVRTYHAGQSVLVVAHSNTVDDIAAAFGAAGLLELTENHFDRMFVITRAWCTTRLVRLRFGSETS